ncbi:transmembrane protein 241 isoform X2 [Microtus ochrogaster]|uniref:Transmembrane protein 241 isoform X2 n=1 Tax=Microtus ochrogaster TaxID=79684 RepID=A0ABM1UBP2_MICOH|nr:transmembrane protein 241 isoform X2 [Microtus ochrogaster]
MIGRRSLLGVTFCTCYLASHLTNKYVLSVLKFTYPTLFQGWQTLIGGLLLHLSWKLGCVELNSSLRSNVLAWLPASVLSVGIIYAGSRALSRLAVPVFFILHNVAEVLICGYQKCVWKEKTSPTKICSALFLVAAAGCLPFQDAQFDADGYSWAVVHLFCVGAYRILRKSQKPSVLSDIDQQYLNYIFSVALLAVASHPTDSLAEPGLGYLYYLWTLTGLPGWNIYDERRDVKRRVFQRSLKALDLDHPLYHPSLFPGCTAVPPTLGDWAKRQNKFSRDVPSTCLSRAPVPGLS